MPTLTVERFVLFVSIIIAHHNRNSEEELMSKANKDVPELSDEELAFEMLEITCDEMDSLARAFDMISDLCNELNGEELATTEAEEAQEELPNGAAIH